MIRHLAVVIPARNEDALLRGCLVTVERATRYLRTRRPDVAASTFVVLDSCSDGSAGIVARFDAVTGVHVSYANVGKSRAAGVRWGMPRMRSMPETTWIANTDADSTVPRNWLFEQIRYADAGIDAVLGTVQPERADLSPRQARAWDLTHSRGRNVGHVHGANLGVRASSYLGVGGFAPLREHEDSDLVSRLRASGATIAATDASPVTTSGRSVGRTPAGYAGYLRALEFSALPEGA